jgi:hypothetical protein
MAAPTTQNQIPYRNLAPKNKPTDPMRATTRIKTPGGI